MLDNNSNVTGLHTAQTNFQVKAIGIKLNPSLLLVQPFECCPWCSALENKRHVLLPSISLVWRARHVQPSLEWLSWPPAAGAALSTCRTPDSPRTHCGLHSVQEAVAHNFVYHLQCLVCFASVEHYSEQCFDFCFFFFFFSPWGFSSTASEGFTSLDDLSLPTSLWGQRHLHATDSKQTGTGREWVTQSHSVFCHLWGDGNSASSNRSLLLSHYVCYSLCREWSTMKTVLKATLNM